jgi:phosphohistidine phosphatase SixA
MVSRWTVCLIAFCLIAFCMCADAAEPSRTIFLVRHAERTGGMAADVPLSEAGRCRANVLSRMLVDAGITAIYTTEVARTQQTAAPLADKLKLTPKVIPAKDVNGLVLQLRAGAANGAALVVGHSNTVPLIIAGLGAGTVPPIDDDSYDHLFVVTMTTPDKATVVTLHYPGCAVVTRGAP